MPRSSPRDPAKERFWRRTLRDFDASRLTVRAFCARRGLSEPAFYFWRRTIADRDHHPRSSRSARAAAPGPTPVPLFVPVRVGPAPVGATPAAAAPSGPAAIEVALASGHVVRVPPGCDPATLRQVLAVLAEAPPC